MILLSPQLQAFLRVHETSTVHGAAQNLGLSQTAVTQRIQALERALGVSLFVRSRKGMRLTSEGESLLRYCREARELEGRTLSEIRGAEGEAELRISGPTSFISGRAVSQCAGLYLDWPKLNIRFVIDDRENRLELIKKGEVDIVILRPHQVPMELDSKRLDPDEYILVASAKWKRRDMREILATERIFAFHPEDPTSLNYLKQFDLLQFLKRPRLFVNENRALITLLVAGAGFGVLARPIAEPLLNDGSLILLNQRKAMKEPLALAWYPRKEMPAYMNEAVRLIR